MKALLDTNILIHREAGRVARTDIGLLFKYLDRAKYTKCIHPVSIQEINKNPNKETVRAFVTKLDSYEQLVLSSPMHDDVLAVAKEFDANPNDDIDSIFVNEGRIQVTNATAVGMRVQSW